MVFSYLPVMYIQSSRQKRNFANTQLVLLALRDNIHIVYITKFCIIICINANLHVQFVARCIGI